MPAFFYVQDERYADGRSRVAGANAKESAMFRMNGMPTVI